MAVDKKDLYNVGYVIVKDLGVRLMQFVLNEKTGSFLLLLISPITFSIRSGVTRTTSRSELASIEHWISWKIISVSSLSSVELYNFSYTSANLLTGD